MKENMEQNGGYRKPYEKAEEVTLLDAFRAVFANDLWPVIHGDSDAVCVEEENGVSWEIDADDSSMLIFRFYWYPTLGDYDLALLKEAADMICLAPGMGKVFFAGTENAPCFRYEVYSYQCLYEHLKCSLLKHRRALSNLAEEHRRTYQELLLLNFTKQQQEAHPRLRRRS